MLGELKEVQGALIGKIIVDIIAYAEARLVSMSQDTVPHI